MTKKELEDLIANEEEKIELAKNRINENMLLILANLKQEKNKDKKKLLAGLHEEFQYIYNILDSEKE